MAKLNVRISCKVSGVTIKYVNITVFIFYMSELWFLIGPEDG